MRKLLKFLGIFLLLMIIAVTGIATYIKFALPDVGDAPDLKAGTSPDIISRGEYLANNVMVCMDCHSTRDWEAFSGPIKAGSLGQGGERFDETMGFPGAYYAANITPSGIGDWTDGEIYRAITSGVRKSGKPIFPVMPHKNYGQLDPDDILAVVAYLRTIPSIDNKVPESEPSFPMNFIINTIPAKATPTKVPSKTDLVNYGKYLVTAASCGDCHTPFDGQAYDEKLHLAGGRSFAMPGGLIYSANLTPDKATGIGNMSKEAFLTLFSRFRDGNESLTLSGNSDFNTIMPWTMYAGMSNEDLEAIYAYLNTLAPKENKVPRGYVRMNN